MKNKIKKLKLTAFIILFPLLFNNINVSAEDINSHKESMTSETYLSEDIKLYPTGSTNNDMMGQIEINKVDENHSHINLPGATFGIYVDDVYGMEKDMLVDEITTNNNGYAITKKLKLGDYYIKELKAPVGYVSDEKEYPISLTENNEIYLQILRNRRIVGDFLLLKTDIDTKTPLQNIIFKLTGVYGFNKDKSQTLFSDKNGLIFSTNLEYGKYKIEEIKTLEGYILNSTPIEFDLNEDGQIVTFEIENEKIKGTLILKRLDEYTKRPIDGVKFKITGLDSFNKNKTWELTTNKQGIVSLENLEYGKYKIEEIETPKGYTLNKTSMEIQIKENKKTVEMEITNKILKGDGKLLKVGECTHSSLKNAIFDLYRSNKVITEYDTNENDEINITYLDN